MTCKTPSRSCARSYQDGDADSEREILDDFWPDLFAAMLNCWLTDEQQWPKKALVR